MGKVADMAQTSPIPKLQVVGGGKMGEALVSGLVASGWATAEELQVVEVVPRRAAELAETVPGLNISDVPGKAAGHVLAVKPHDVRPACASLVAEFSLSPVLSIAAGITIDALEGALPEGTPVVRAMPNTPSLVGAGAAAIAPGHSAGDEELAWAEQVLGAVGLVVRVDEPLLDAVTGLSGSGPAYIFLVAEAMTEAGVLAGLPRATSAQLVVQTLVGAGKLLAESGSGPALLRAGVTSPGGTTASGLRALEQAGTRAAFLDAVMAAAERSRQLGS